MDFKNPGNLVVGDAPHDGGFEVGTKTADERGVRAAQSIWLREVGGSILDDGTDGKVQHSTLHAEARRRWETETAVKRGWRQIKNG